MVRQRMGLLQPHLAIEKCGHRPWIDGWFSGTSQCWGIHERIWKHIKTIYQHISYISYIHPFLQVHSKLCSFRFCACLMVEKTSGLSGLAIPPLPVRCRGSSDAHDRRISLKWFDRMDRPFGAEGVSCGSIRRLQKYRCRSLGNILPRYGQPSDRFSVPLIHRQWRWTKCCEGEQPGDGCEWVFSFSFSFSSSLPLPLSLSSSKISQVLGPYFGDCLIGG